MAKPGVIAIVGVATSLALFAFGPSAAEPLRIPDTMLEPGSFAALDGWNDEDHAAALKTFRNSCQPILRKRARALLGRHFEEALRQVCERLSKLESPTDKAAARRFEYTGSGKLVRTRHGKSHLRRNRSKRAAREYDEMMPVSPRDLKRILRLMPYAT